MSFAHGLFSQIVSLPFDPTLPKSSTTLTGLFPLAVLNFIHDGLSGSLASHALALVGPQPLSPWKRCALKSTEHEKKQEETGDCWGPPNRKVISYPIPRIALVFFFVDSTAIDCSVR